MSIIGRKLEKSVKKCKKVINRQKNAIIWQSFVKSDKKCKKVTKNEKK